MLLSKLDDMSKQDIVSSLRHEIKNPLNASMTGSFCLNRTINKVKNIVLNEQELYIEKDEILSLLKESEEAVFLINEGNNRIMQILSNLQISLSSGHVAKELYNLKYILKSCIVLFNRQLECKSIKTKIQIENETNIFCNQGEINQVFTNLIMNSCDAMPNGGSITIRSKIKTIK